MIRGVFLDAAGRLDQASSMADGFDIHVSSDLARRIAEEAEITGQTPEAVALAILTEAFEPLDWAEDVRRAEEYDRTGNGSSVEEAFSRIRARLTEKLSERG
jgi:hypothetical protein